MVTPAPPPAGHGRRHDPRFGSGAPDPIPGLSEAFVAIPVPGTSESDFTINSSNTLADVPNVRFHAAADATYQWKMTIFSNSNATADIQFQVNAPSGAAGMILGTYYVSGWQHGTLTYGSNQPVDGVAADILTIFEGILINGATPGDVQLQAAQNTSNASDTVVKAGSNVMAVKIA